MFKEFRTFSFYFNKNNDWEKRKLLKIDCEGCEWKVFDSFDDKVLLSFE